MKKSSLISLLLCLVLALGACGKAAPESQPAEPPAAESAETPAEAPEAAAEPETAPEPEAAPAYDLAAYEAAAEAIKAEYLQVREEGLDSFDEAVHPELPWYTAVLTRFPENNYYEARHDFDGNGVPELLIALGSDDAPNPVGVYTFDGRDMHYLCPEQPLGERAYLSYRDGLFIVRASGGASTGSLVLYRIAEDGWSTEFVDEIRYEYSDAEHVTYVSELDAISPEELQARGLDRAEGLDVALDWSCFFRADGQAEIGMPNPWTEAGSAQEAAAGAGLESFAAPEALEGFGPVRWAFLDGVAQAEYNSVDDRLLIRKGSGIVEISGDYTAYPEEWTFSADGSEVRCAGYGEQIHRAEWTRGGDSFSLTVNPGIEELSGLSGEALLALVGQIR